MHLSIISNPFISVHFVSDARLGKLMMLEAEDLSEEDRVFAKALQQQISLFVKKTTRFHGVLELPRGRAAFASLVCGDQVRVFDDLSGIYLIERNSISNGIETRGELVRLKAVNVADGRPISIRSNQCIDGRYVIETDDGNWFSEQSISGGEVQFDAIGAPNEDYDPQPVVAAEVVPELMGILVSWTDPISGERRNTQIKPVGLYAALGSFNKIEGLTLHTALDDETGCVAFDLPGRFFAIMGADGRTHFIDNYLASAQLAAALGDGLFLTAIPYSRFLPVLRCPEKSTRSPKPQTRLNRAHPNQRISRWLDAWYTSKNQLDLDTYRGLEDRAVIEGTRDNHRNIDRVS